MHASPRAPAGRASKRTIKKPGTCARPPAEAAEQPSRRGSCALARLPPCLAQPCGRGRRRVGGRAGARPRLAGWLGLRLEVARARPPLPLPARRAFRGRALSCARFLGLLIRRHCTLSIRWENFPAGFRFRRRFRFRFPGAQPPPLRAAAVAGVVRTRAEGATPRGSRACAPACDIWQGWNPTLGRAGARVRARARARARHTRAPDRTPRHSPRSPPADQTPWRCADSWRTSRPSSRPTHRRTSRAPRCARARARSPHTMGVGGVGLGWEAGEVVWGGQAQRRWREGWGGVGGEERAHPCLSRLRESVRALLARDPPPTNAIAFLGLLALLSCCLRQGLCHPARVRPRTAAAHPARAHDWARHVCEWLYG